MPWEKLPIVDCAGSSPGEVGRAQGLQLAGRIAAALDFYSSRFSLLGLATEEVRRWGEGYQREVRDHAPELAEEIEGIAAGSGREAWELFALNARSEIFAAGLRSAGRTTPGECTALYCAASGLLAQNWDWEAEYQELPVLLRIPRGDRGPGILTLSEPGMVGKVGLNDCGVGVCLNFVSGPEPPAAPTGLPVHCLLRLALQCDSLAKAHAALRAAPRHCACHILLADSIGQFRMLEFAGAELECAGSDPTAHDIGLEDPIEGEELPPPPPTVVAHTNHFLHPRFQGLSRDLLHTKERLGRVQELASSSDGGHAAAGAGGVDEHLMLVKRILGDSCVGPQSILVVDGPPLVPGGGPMATICSIAMDLRSRHMHVTRGSAQSQEYSRVPLAPSSL